MGTSQSVPDLVAAARKNAKALEDQIAEISSAAEGRDAPEELRAATTALELAAVDVFTLFEARMQHHFRRGPFSRKLSTLLGDSGEGDLADRVHQYYLAINVLKHGKGASYRELLSVPNPQFGVKTAEAENAGEAIKNASLIDVCEPGFFDGLIKTILEAHSFLEKK